MTKDKPTKPTRKELDRWLELETERLELDRRKKALGALQDEIEEKCLAYVRHAGGEARVVMVSDFRLEIALHRNAVQWKNEFIRELGDDGHKRAEALIAAAGTKEVLKIEPPQ